MTSADQPIFVDANVLLEATLQGRRQVAIAQRYLNQHPVVISPLSAHLYVHFGRKEGRKLAWLFEQLAEQQFTEFGTAEIGWAMTNCQSDDFEDALQVACAVLHGCREFVTFDRTLAKRYRAFIRVRVLK